ncbi:hypothetical protein BCT05_06870 [Vibrio breoganii]|uniref:glycosyltransferase n=1 Tax=Vibrio breoganii TaxID=553239 RepID=UPI000C85C7D5|nr:glycosyltransferase [Vibrio breoganii]PMO67493.1 hypothetical protein BCT05_06870 [Vibrio breoganii]
MKKKILFVIDTLGSGGAQKQITNLAIELHKMGKDVTVLSYHKNDFFRGVLDAENIESTCIEKGKGILGSIRFIYSYRKYCLTNRFSHVVSFLDGPNFYSEIVRILCFFKFKLVVSERFMTVGKHTFSSIFLNYSHFFSSFITVNSHHQYQRMLKDFPWMKKKLRVIYNGYSYDEVEKRKVNRNRTKFLAVSSLASKKNPINTLYALGKLKNKGYVFDFEWVGSYTTSAEGNLVYKKCKELVDKLDLDCCVQFTGETQDVKAKYIESTWLIHPSFYEGLPNVVCEALACGLPILASDVCDHPILVDTSGAGYMFDPHSIDSIALALENAINTDNSKYLSLSNSARKFYKENLTSRIYASKYIELMDV